MCMHCQSLWSRINNLLVIDQYIYLGCPIATKGHSTILEKKNCQTAQEPARSSLSLHCWALPTPSPPNTATGKIQSIERDRCCRPLMSHGRSATVETCSPSRQRRLEVTDTGDPAIRRCHPELLCQRRGRGLMAVQVLDRRAYRIGPPRCCWPPPVSL